MTNKKSIDYDNPNYDWSLLNQITHPALESLSHEDALYLKKFATKWNGILFSWTEILGEIPRKTRFGTIPINMAQQYNELWTHYREDVSSLPKNRKDALEVAWSRMLAGDYYQLGTKPIRFQRVMPVEGVIE